MFSRTFVGLHTGPLSLRLYVRSSIHPLFQYRYNMQVFVDAPHRPPYEIQPAVNLFDFQGILVELLNVVSVTDFVVA